MINDHDLTIFWKNASLNKIIYNQLILSVLFNIYYSTQASNCQNKYNFL